MGERDGRLGRPAPPRSAPRGPGRGRPGRARDALPRARLRRRRAGRQPRLVGGRVVSRGWSGAGFFVIAEGEATVGAVDRPAARLGRHDFFGEVALIDGGRRSADITAVTNLRCWGISQREFRAFVKQHPEVAWALLEVLVARLRAAEGAAAGRPRAPRRRWWSRRRR